MEQWLNKVAMGFFYLVAICVCLVLIVVSIECALHIPWVEELLPSGKVPDIYDLTEARRSNQLADQRLEASRNEFDANQKELAADAISNRSDEHYQLCEIIGDTPARDEKTGAIIGNIAAGTVVRYFPLIERFYFNGDLKKYVLIALQPFEKKNLCVVPVEMIGKLVNQAIPEWLPMASTDPAIAYQWYVELAPGQTSPPLPVSVDRVFNYEFFATGHGAQVFRHFNDGPWELLVGGRPKPQPRLRESFSVQVRLHPAADRKERIRFVLKNPQGDQS